ncbi:hypothetical protein ACQKTA_04260 [Enterococcus sp. 22-H-5-01]|uniref:hypothetical protein n=1 Tax=Enterococcus sp. 22-H-5-01 TaxID=3418555 RepID=UPI003D036964
MKKIETIETIICDICGKEADGEFFTFSRVNGNPTGETYCPHDLCREHMEKWFRLWRVKEIRRYENNPTNDKRAEMLNEFSELLKEEDGK